MRGVLGHQSIVSSGKEELVRADVAECPSSRTLRDRCLKKRDDQSICV